MPRGDAISGVSLSVRTTCFPQGSGQGTLMTNTSMLNGDASDFRSMVRSVSASGSQSRLPTTFYFESPAPQQTTVSARLKRPFTAPGDRGLP